MVKLTERLVEEDNFGIDSKRAGKRYALPHATRQLMDVFVIGAVETYSRKPFPSTRPCL